MAIIKNEFMRFFTVGFAGGALLVAATMGIGPVGAASLPARAAHPVVTR